MKKRIKGIDVARALAVIGMIIVNFKIVLGENGESWFKSFASLFDGKAAATFVVLAGVGLALSTKSAIKNNDQAKLKSVKKRIAKRALFLFVIGLSYIFIWPADILHFYGVYMTITILLLSARPKVIIATATAMILAYPLLFLFFNYEAGWNFEVLEYLDFWTLKGFLRNLFFNGFHPVLPWTAFMLFGYWLGGQDLRNRQFLKRILGFSIAAFVGIQVLSWTLISVLSEGSPVAAQELGEILGTAPMPPLPIYMFSGTAIAFAVISACILIAERFEDSFIIDALNKTGQLALTFYVAHVIIGMGMIEVFSPGKLGQYNIEFSVIYALIFSALCIVFAVVWTKYKKAGPLEWLMRKITG